MVEVALVIAVVSFLLLFPLFLMLCSEYLEDYIAGVSSNEDMEADGGYVGMVQESMSNSMNEALIAALEESRLAAAIEAPEGSSNFRIRKRRKAAKAKAKAKKKLKGKPSTRGSRFPRKNKNKSQWVIFSTTMPRAQFNTMFKRNLKWQLFIQSTRYKYHIKHVS